MITQVLEVERFFDLLAATEHVKQYGGRIELSEYGEYWRVVHDVPDHDDPVHPHCPFNPVPGCAECAKWLDASVRADVVEVEGVAAR